METEHTYTVSELTRVIKQTLEDSFYSVWVQGEISNFTRHSSGHFYFSLKDEHAQISAVMWRGKNTGLYFTPQDGIKVLAKGRISVFEKRGVYQLDVDTLQPLGVGELQFAFEQLKARLSGEGLFDAKWKKTLPVFPDAIGIVTSPTGAAIRDLISVSKRRFPGVRLILRPVNVQGEGAAEEIARAIDEFNEFGGVDVLIVGRGGGSLEDLWAFNEEVTARAIFRSAIPVVSAVGHEIDFTIADFVADVRAPTPSSAAEIVVPNTADIWESIRQRIQHMVKITRDRFQYYDEKIGLLESSRAFQAPIELIKQYALQLDVLSARFNLSYQNRINRRVENIAQWEMRLHALNPENVLKRGYSITAKLPGNEIVYRSSQLKRGDRVTLRFGEGEAAGDISSVR